MPEHRNEIPRANSFGFGRVRVLQMREWAAKKAGVPLGFEIETKKPQEYPVAGGALEANAVPGNEPPVRFSGGSSRAYGEKEYLRDHGVKVESTANGLVRIQMALRYRRIAIELRCRKNPAPRLGGAIPTSGCSHAVCRAAHGRGTCSEPFSLRRGPAAGKPAYCFAGTILIVCALH